MFRDVDLLHRGKVIVIYSPLTSNLLIAGIWGGVESCG